MARAEERIAALRDMARAREVLSEAGDNPALIQLARPGIRGSHAYECRRVAREIRESALGSDPLAARAAALLDACSDDAIDLVECDRLREKLQRVGALFLSRKYGGEPGPILSKIGVALGFLRTPRARIKSRDMREVAHAYDAMTGGDYSYCVFVDNDLTGFGAIQEPYWIARRIVGSHRASEHEDEPGTPLCDDEDDFGVDQIDARWGKRWCVRGCPLSPDQALVAIQEIFAFPSTESAIDELRKEHAVIGHEREQLAEVDQDTDVRTYLDQLPEMNGLFGLRHRLSK